MKIFKSIKWRLQIWYGLILVVVLVALGFSAYQLERERLFQSVDQELQRRFTAIANALHPHPPGHRPFDHFPPDNTPGDSPPPEDSNGNDFHLPDQDADLFSSENANNFYFIIYREGEEFAHSTNVPYASSTDSRMRGLNLSPPPGINDGGLPQGPKTFDAYKLRELAHPLPPRDMVVVGCSIAPEVYELKMTALKLTGIGVVILFFGLAGGWWISSRAIRPVENISATAIKISAGDLSQRINTAETESELGQLATVLNSTFARLESAFAQQKQFASDAAHELRTPVSVILTQAQTALSRDRQPPEYKQTIEACQRAAQRMRKLISSLLELARLDAGQEQMKRLPFDLSKTVADCVELVRPLADEHGVKISTKLSPIEIKGDSERMSLVVTNLLTNAIQYNHDGGAVTITAMPEHGMAVLTVKDTGIGIPPEDLPRVFERFYRADKSRSSGNAGLGLAISKAIVSAHGGSIDVTSEENAGTTFIVRLPLI